MSFVQRSASVFLAVMAIAACGESKLSEAPRASSLNACFATRDAARAAEAIVYANTSRYPTTFAEMTMSNPPVLVPPDGVSVTADQLEGEGWTLTMSGGGATAPRFTCASAPLG